MSDDCDTCGAPRYACLCGVVRSVPSTPEPSVFAQLAAALKRAEELERHNAELLKYNGDVHAAKRLACELRDDALKRAEHAEAQRDSARRTYDELQHEVHNLRERAEAAERELVLNKRIGDAFVEEMLALRRFREQAERRLARAVEALRKIRVVAHESHIRVREVVDAALAEVGE